MAQLPRPFGALRDGHPSRFFRQGQCLKKFRLDRSQNTILAQFAWASFPASQKSVTRAHEQVLANQGRTVGEPIGKPKPRAQAGPLGWAPDSSALLAKRWAKNPTLPAALAPGEGFGACGLSAGRTKQKRNQPLKRANAHTAHAASKDRTARCCGEARSARVGLQCGGSISVLRKVTLLGCRYPSLSAPINREAYPPCTVRFGTSRFHSLAKDRL